MFLLVNLVGVMIVGGVAAVVISGLASVADRTAPIIIQQPTVICRKQRS
jgi:hypothetical protein